jgi:Family of unknown function (DUF6152)
MTRMTHASIVATLLTVPVLVERVDAHHGAGLYDPRKNVELEGRLTRLAFVNPHSYVYFDVVGNDGKEPSGNKYSMSPCSSRVNRVIPVTVEAMPFEAHRGHLGVRHRDAARIVAAIQL